MRYKAHAVSALGGGYMAGLIGMARLTPHPWVMGFCGTMLFALGPFIPLFSYRSMLRQDTRRLEINRQSHLALETESQQLELREEQGTVGANDLQKEFQSLAKRHVWNLSADAHFEMDHVMYVDHLTYTFYLP